MACWSERKQHLFHECLKMFFFFFSFALTDRCFRGHIRVNKIASLGFHEHVLATFASAITVLLIWVSTIGTQNGYCSTQRPSAELSSQSLPSFCSPMWHSAKCPPPAFLVKQSGKTEPNIPHKHVERKQVIMYSFRCNFVEPRGLTRDEEDLQFGWPRAGGKTNRLEA